MYLALYPKINTTFPSQWSTVYLAKLVINRNFFFLKTNCVWHYHITILNCSFIYIKKTFYSYKKASKGKIHKQNTPKLHSCLILSLAQAYEFYIPFIYTCTHTHAFIPMYRDTFVCVCVQIYICIDIYMCIYIYIYTHTKVHHTVTSLLCLTCSEHTMKLKPILDIQETAANKQRKENNSFQLNKIFLRH